MATKDTTTPETPPEETTTPVAAAPEPTPGAGDLVSYRVLKAGDGLIHTGRFIPGSTEPETYARGDQVDNVPREIAEGLEDRHYAEIID